MICIRMTLVLAVWQRGKQPTTGRPRPLLCVCSISPSVLTQDYAPLSSVGLLFAGLLRRVELGRSDN